METSRLEAGSAGVTADAFRGFMGNLFTGVSIVTSVDADGSKHGLTCNSLVSITLDPPTLLVCLNRGCGTLAAVRSCGSFAVNVLSERGRAAAETFAAPSPDRFAEVTWCQSPRRGLPVLPEDSFGVAECDVLDLHEVGDHVAVFGRVAGLDHRPDRPLLYGQRSFAGPPIPVQPIRP